LERRPNKLRKKLNAGELVTGTVLYSWSPNVVDAAGYAGLDFIRLDLEHTYSLYTSMEHVMRACYIADVVPIVRVDKENVYLVRKVLEIGAGGVLVPDVESADKVEEIVAETKFPPVGKRGYSGNIMAAGFGARAGKDWVEYSNAEPMVGVMIENVHAMECLEEILAVEGLDFVHFGPSDYSMSLGLGKPDWNHPDVMDAIQKTIEAARNVGKHIVLGVGQDREKIRVYREMGIDMLELANDLAVLRKVWTDLDRFVKVK
jgi:4-hydroxy-2-oxoheptanedioate aldolase